VRQQQIWRSDFLIILEFAFSAWAGAGSVSITHPTLLEWSRGLTLSFSSLFTAHFIKLPLCLAVIIRSFRNLFSGLVWSTYPHTTLYMCDDIENGSELQMQAWVQNQRQKMGL
jgi:hypothetical protein